MMTNRLQHVKFEQSTMDSGAYEERISPDNQIVAMKWQDNKPVVVVSSVCGGLPSTGVLR